MKDISHKMDLLFKDVQAIKKAISDPKKDSVETSPKNVTFTSRCKASYSNKQCEQFLKFDKIGIAITINQNWHCLDLGLCKPNVSTY